MLVVMVVWYARRADQLTGLCEESDRCLQIGDSVIVLGEIEGRLAGKHPHLLSQLDHLLLLDDEVFPCEHLDLCIVLSLLQECK